MSDPRDSHVQAIAEEVPVRVDDACDWAAARLADAGLHFGHGADNPHSEAIILLAGATGLALDTLMAEAARPLEPPARARLAELVAARLASRRPAAYLVGRAWFAGLEFEVDERVLIPRSPLAEFLAVGGAPWLDPARVGRVLDLGTGSGCLAIAAAMAFPEAQVDAADLSRDALAVAAANVRRHGLEARVRLVVSDHFAGLAGERYDLILSNPPYVPAARLSELPAEYAHEPAMALVSGDDGLDSVRAILQDAGGFLRPGGVLVVEVGEVDEAVARTWPELPFTWLEFEHGGSGVFLLEADSLSPPREP
ncbi:MAG: 50S ribosomal protein L3 N(5)-glutamine methyltransferase [Gammaproteobacteria bacterium]|nr:50S ribosomal protein L3 N(5)-glutamine methyltransferase [Gammaproteobacteria bacterium]